NVRAARGGAARSPLLAGGAFPSVLRVRPGAARPSHCGRGHVRRAREVPRGCGDVVSAPGALASTAADAAVCVPAVGGLAGGAPGMMMATDAATGPTRTDVASAETRTWSPLIVRNIVHNSGWLLIDRIVRLAVQFVLIAWLARYLGPHQFGLLSYALAFV